MTDTNNTDGAALLPVTHPIDMLREMLALEIERTSGAESFMIRSGLLADLLDELATHRISHSLPGDVGMRGVLSDIDQAIYELHEGLTSDLPHSEAGWINRRRFENAEARIKAARETIIAALTPSPLSTPQRQEYDGEAVREALEDAFCAGWDARHDGQNYYESRDNYVTRALSATPAQEGEGVRLHRITRAAAERYSLDIPTLEHFGLLADSLSPAQPVDETDRLREMDVEGIGDALGALSGKLLASGFLNDDANHRAYEKVVAEFQALSSKGGRGRG